MPTFFNQATLSYSGGTVNSNVTIGEIVEVLSASKTAVVDNYTQGSQITYILNLVNSGATDLTGLTIVDDLGGAPARPLAYVTDSVTYFVNGVQQAAPAVTDEAPLTITNITVPAEGNAAVLYAVRVTDFASPEAEGSIENTAVISANGISDVTVSETVTTADAPRLSITKALSPTTVTENGQITYTFVIQNSGNVPAVATDNVIVTDAFDPILSNVLVMYNGASWTEPDDYTYNETTGVFTTALGAITVPAATFTQDPATGAWVTDPGTAVITVTGTI